MHTEIPGIAKWGESIVITTICLNPALDKTATTSQLLAGGLNILENIRHDVGGKGINVALALGRMGVECACIGCVGTMDEELFSEALERENVRFLPFSTLGRVRTNLKLLEKNTGIITELNELGPVMNRAQQMQFISMLRQEVRHSEYVIFSGRLPAGCADTMYEECLQALPKHQCIVDTSGNALLAALSRSPLLIKPNLFELEAAAGCALPSIEEIKRAAIDLVGQGAQNVVVSMGGDGALCTDGNKTVYSPAIRVEVKSTVGAGDTMLAGMAAGLYQKMDMPEAFRIGMAAAAAAVMTEGTLPMHKKDFERLLPSVVQYDI